MISEVTEVPYLDITNKLDKNVDVLFLVSSMLGITSKKVKKFIESIDVKVDNVILIGPKLTTKCLRKELELNGINCDKREFTIKPTTYLPKNKEEIKVFTKKILGKK